MNQCLENLLLHIVLFLRLIFKNILLIELCVKMISLREKAEVQALSVIFIIIIHLLITLCSSIKSGFKLHHIFFLFSEKLQVLF